MTPKDELSPLLRKALKLLEQGHEDKARILLSNAKQEATEKNAFYCFDFVLAAFDDGLFHLAAGNLEEGTKLLAQTLRNATIDEESWTVIGSMSYQLGTALNLQRRYPEAIPVLRQCIQVRTKAFGSNDSDCHAARLELAESLLCCGNVAEAQTIVREILPPLLAEKNLLAFDCLAIKCAHDTLMNIQTPELQYIVNWQDGDNYLFIDRFVERLRAFDNMLQIRVLEQLCATALQFLPDIKLLIKLRILREVAWTATLGSQFNIAVHYLTHSIALANHFEDTAEAFWSLISLAHVYSRAGNIDAAKETLTTAVKAAQDDANESLLAHALGCYANLIWLSGGDPAQAEQLYRQSVAAATQDGDRNLLSNAQADYGVFLHHQNRHREARQLFAIVLAQMDDRCLNLATIHSHLYQESNQCICAVKPLDVIFGTARTAVANAAYLSSTVRTFFEDADFPDETSEYEE